MEEQSENARFFFFKTNKTQYVFDCNSFSVYQTDKKLHEKLTNNDFDGEGLEEEDKKLLFQLRDEKLPELFKSETKNAHLSICYTNKCNMNCSYCYRKKENTAVLSKQEIRNIISFASEKYKPEAGGFILSIGLTSEPLLDEPTLKLIEDEISKHEVYDFTESDFEKIDSEDVYDFLPIDIKKKYDEKKGNFDTIAILNEIIKKEYLNDYYDMKGKIGEYFNSFIDNEKYLDEHHLCFLNRTIMEKLFEGNIRSCNPKWYNMSFFTNGTCITDEKIHFIKSINMRNICVSIDGPEEIHNYSRKYANGSGTYKDVLNGINILIKNNIPVIASCVFTPKYPEPYKIIMHLKKLGVSSISFHIVRPERTEYFDKNSMTKLLLDFKNVYSQVFTDIQNDDYHLLDMLKDTLMFIPMSNIYKKLRVYERCSWGTEAIVDNKGDIYRCLYLIGDKNERVGNYKDGITYKDVEDYITVDKVEGCKVCWARQLCGGTCYYVSKLLNGRMDKKDEIECQFRKGLIEQSIKFYITLVENNLIKKVLQRII